MFTTRKLGGRLSFFSIVDYGDSIKDGSKKTLLSIMISKSSVFVLKWHKIEYNIKNLLLMYKIFFKQFLDILIATLAMAFLLPFFAIISIIIIIDSNGPVFFLQERLGLRKKKFTVIKFRTMTHSINREETQVFIDNPEITKVGKFLRRFKIDELPQIFNVLTGSMSIIGPRPCLPQAINKFGSYADYRFKVKPGLSSMAGVNGSIYLSWNEKGFYDRYYTENISFTLDFKIIIKTVLVIIYGEKKFLNRPKINDH